MGGREKNRKMTNFYEKSRFFSLIFFLIFDIFRAGGQTRLHPFPPAEGHRCADRHLLRGGRIADHGKLPDLCGGALGVHHEKGGHPEPDQPAVPHLLRGA